MGASCTTDAFLAKPSLVGDFRSEYSESDFRDPQRIRGSPTRPAPHSRGSFKPVEREREREIVLGGAFVPWNRRGGGASRRCT